MNTMASAPSGPALWRGMDRPTLDAAYDSSAVVSDFQAITGRWPERSAPWRARPDTRLDVPYADAPRCRVDLFGPADASPLVVFLHGGYWQMRGREQFSFLAEGPLAHGLGFAAVGYTLGPEAGMDRIVDECRQALAFLQRETGRPIVLSGWSAGGHLTACLQNEAGVIGSLAISGLYELEPIRLGRLNDKLGMDAATARRHSPLHHLPAGSPPMVIAWGEAEQPELRQQSLDYAAAREAAGLPTRRLPLAGLHHFDELDTYADPQGAMALALVELAKG